MLKIEDGKYPLSDKIREFLTSNATYVRSRNVWLFEGDWAFEPELDEVKVEEIAQIVVPSLGGLTDEQISKIVDRGLR